MESDMQQMASSSVLLEADVSDGGELPPLWAASRPGERKDLDQDVGCCDQDGASGAVPAEQWTGEGRAHLHPQLSVGAAEVPTSMAALNLTSPHVKRCT